MALVHATRRLWPWIMIGLALGSALVVALVAPSAINFGGLVAGLCENLIVALLRRLRPRSALDESPLDAVRVLGCVLGGSAVASVAFAVIGLSGSATLMDLWSEFARNHLLGLMLVSPCLAVSIGREEFRAQLRDRRANLEWLTQLSVTTLLSSAVFLTHQHVVGSSVVVLPLVWGALRLGPLRAMTGLLVIATMAAVGTSHGLGRISALDHGDDGVITLQIAIGTLALTTMATAVAGRLRERAMRLVRRRTEDLNTAERLAGIGSVRWDTASGRMVWSQGLHLVLGTDPARDQETTQTYTERLHPDDRERVLEDGARLAEDTGEARHLEYRIVRPDGEVRQVAIRSATERSTGGGKEVFTTVQDVTEARAAAAEVDRAHQELSAVLDAVTGTAILGTDREDGTLTFFNVGRRRCSATGRRRRSAGSPRCNCTTDGAGAARAGGARPAAGDDGDDRAGRGVQPAVHVRAQGRHDIPRAARALGQTPPGRYPDGVHRRHHRPHRGAAGPGRAGGERQTLPAGVRHLADGHGRRLAGRRRPRPVPAGERRALRVRRGR
nr:MASE1 domain-containing protein [Kineosporia corallincola]